MSPPYKYLEFYKKYNLSYWSSKIALLSNSNEHYDKIKDTLNQLMDEPDHSNFKLMLKIELHFFYYQIAEALFELIFALENEDEINIWETISFSSFSTYDKIKAITEGNEEILTKNISFPANEQNDTINIPFLQWVFFHHLDFHKVNSDIDGNLNTIRKLLKIIANDFSNHKEYNAFKHSLRFICDEPYAAFSPIGEDKKFEFSAKEGFGYLVKTKEKSEIKIQEVVKSFSYEKDLKMCVYCSWLIHNIITSRRFFYFGIQDKLMFFNSIPIEKIFDKVDVLAEISFTKEIINCT